MAAEKTDAIVLRVTEFSETSCVVVLFTRGSGKISALAKGARRPKSPFEAALDVLSICRIVFLHKTSSLSLLTEAKLERRFRAAERSLNQLYAGFYVIELLKSLTDEGDPHPGLYDMAVDLLIELDSTEWERPELNRRMLRFELGMLGQLGHLPMLTQCVGCGRLKTRHTRVYFGLAAGGVLCHRCRAGQPHVVVLSADGHQQMVRLMGPEATLPANQVQEGSSDFEIEPSDTDPRITDANESAASQDEFSEVRGLINLYLSHLIGQPPRLQRFLNKY